MEAFLMISRVRRFWSACLIFQGNLLEIQFEFVAHFNPVSHSMWNFISDHELIIFVIDGASIIASLCDFAASQKIDFLYQSCSEIIIDAGPHFNKRKNKENH